MPEGEIKRIVARLSVSPDFQAGKLLQALAAISEHVGGAIESLTALVDELEKINDLVEGGIFDVVPDDSSGAASPVCVGVDMGAPEGDRSAEWRMPEAGDEAPEDAATLSRDKLYGGMLEAGKLSAGDRAPSAPPPGPPSRLLKEDDIPAKPSPRRLAQRPKPAPQPEPKPQPKPVRVTVPPGSPDWLAPALGVVQSPNVRRALEVLANDGDLTVNAIVYTFSPPMKEMTAQGVLREAGRALEQVGWELVRDNTGAYRPRRKSPETGA